MRIIGRVIVTVAAMAVLEACGRSPAAPTNVVLGVRVTGPLRVALGATASYTATADYLDGPSKDVTTAALWLPSTDYTSGPAYFTSPGIARGANRGEIDLLARFGPKTGVLHVVVLEDGTYKLAGSVVESSGRVISGVSIDVVSGTGTGLHATTNSQGEYALYGVAGSVQLRVSADGYSPQTSDIVVTSDGSTDSFTLTPLETPVDVSGAWTMTLAPSAQCPAAFPDIARGRAYQVHFTQQGTSLKVDVSSPTLTDYNPGKDYGTVLGSQLRFFLLGNTDYGDWSVGNLVDHLSSTETLDFEGTVHGTIAGSRVQGTLDGDLVYWNSAVPTSNFKPNWYCRATNHTATLQR